ncbi:MAG: hypothetical protein IIC67_11875, partial [Thaumarchaeota archaeon]|nr:hypothetical protein [Nitrososphaerota archaeon]
MQNHMSSDPAKALINDGTNDLSYSQGKDWLEGGDSEPRDSDGSHLARVKHTKTGWGYQLHGIEVTTSDPDKIFNTDEEDKLNIFVRSGDGLFIENRNEEGLIPKIVHISSEDGTTSFFNNGFHFILNGDEIIMAPKKQLDIEQIREGNYQSVALEIESDSPNIQKKLRINSYRQFCLLSKGNEELVTFNKYDLPCSARLKDNEIQTIEQLMEKYPSIDFSVPEIQSFGLFTGEIKNDLYGLKTPPYLLHIADTFFESTDGAIQNFDEVQFTDEFNAGVGGSKLRLGRRALEPNEDFSSMIQIREIISPLQVLTHEYEHR